MERIRQQDVRLNGAAAVGIAPDVPAELVEFVGHRLGDLCNCVEWSREIGDIGDPALAEPRRDVYVEIRGRGAVVQRQEAARLGHLEAIREPFTEPDLKTAP